MVYRATPFLLLVALLGFTVPCQAADELAAARSFVQSGHCALAKMELEAVRSSSASPSARAEATFLLGECAARAGRWEVAAHHFDAYGRRVPAGPRAVEALILGGRACERLGDKHAAANRYTRVIDHHSGSTWEAEALVRRGRYNLGEGRPGLARGDFEAAGRLQGAFAIHALYDLGLMQADATELDMAVTTFRQVLASAVDTLLLAHARTELARSLHRAGRHEEALVVLESGPGNGDVDRVMGEVLLALDRPAEARPHLERAALADGADAEVAYSLAWCKLAEGEWEAAESDFVSLAVQPTWAGVAGLAAAESALRGGARARARVHLEDVLAGEIDPDLRARALLRQFRLDSDRAEEVLENAVALQGINPEVRRSALMSYGRRMLDAGRPKVAAEAYGEAVEIAARSGLDAEGPRYGRMLSLLASGDYTDAVDVELGVDEDGRFLLVEAEAYIASDRFEAAAHNYQSLLDRTDLDPMTEQEALFGLGWCLLQGPDPRESLEVFDRLASRHGESERGVEALMRIGDAFVLLSRPDAAFEFYGLYLQHEPRGRLAVAAHQGRAESMLRMGKTGEAVKAARASRLAAAGDPDREAHAFLLEARARFVEQHYAASESLFVQCAARAVDGALVEQGLNGVGDSRLEGGDPVAAVRAYGLVLRRFPAGAGMPRAVAGLLRAADASGGRIEGRTELGRIRRELGPRADAMALQEAVFLLENGHSGAAEIAFAEVTQEYAASSVAEEAWFAQARIRAEAGDADSAQVIWRRLVESGTGEETAAAARSLLAWNALASGSPSEVIDWIGDGNAMSIRDTLALGLAHLDRGETVVARTFLAQVGRDPRADGLDRWRARVSLAKLDLATEGTGLEVLEAAVAEAPSLIGAEAQYEIARHHYRLGSADAALQGFLRIPHLFPGETTWIRRSRMGAAATYEYDDRPSDARAMYQEVVDQDSTDTWAASALRRLEELGP